MLLPLAVSQEKVSKKPSEVRPNKNTWKTIGKQSNIRCSMNLRKAYEGPLESLSPINIVDKRKQRRMHLECVRSEPFSGFLVHSDDIVA